MLQAYAERESARFHMPGHKAKKAFNARFSACSLDITELDFSDCLRNPNGVIGRAEADIAKAYGAVDCSILTDGSTQGVFSMLYAVSNRQGKLLVPRNAHSSVFNAAEVLRIDVEVYNGNEIGGKYVYDSASIIEKLADKACFGVLLTSPDYFGNCVSADDIRSFARADNKLILVDGAHGGNLKYTTPKLHASAFADAYCESAHKSFPTLTQGALLFSNNHELAPRLRHGADIFGTTSPSYPIMASVEYGVCYMENHGQTALRRLTELLDGVKRETQALGLCFIDSDDCARLIVDCAASHLDGLQLNAVCESQGVYAELVSRSKVLFLASVLTDANDVDKLRKSLITAINTLPRVTIPAEKTVCGKRVIDYITARQSPSRLVELNRSEGLICAENVGITPPCFPVVLAGETITAECIELLSRGTTFGLQQGKICVVDVR